MSLKKVISLKFNNKIKNCTYMNIETEGSMMLEKYQNFNSVEFVTFLVFSWAGTCS